MQPQRQRIWDIPEIGCQLALFFQDDQLAAVAAVCKSWYSTFSPVLYSRLCWQGFGHAKRPSKDVIEAHSDEIRSLYLRGDTFDFPFEAVRYLKKLGFDTRTQDGQVWDRFIELIRRNTRLDTIEITLSTGIRMHELVKSLDSCSSLLKLKLSCRHLNQICTELIFNTCTRLQELHLSARWSDGCRPFGESAVFPEMRTLHFDMGDGPSLNRQLEFIQRCPGLRSLSWTTSYLLPINDICKVFSENCRQLSRLSFASPILDGGIARVLDSCREITAFHDSDSNFGPSAFQSLERHFAMLVHLNVGTRSSMTSTMVQAIMSSCPELISLTAPALNVQDILGPIERHIDVDTGVGIVEAIHAHGWVCLNLCSFEVRICGLNESSVNSQRLVLQQLARLEKLSVLNISSTDKKGNWNSDGLDLCLDAGLDILAKLRRLEKIAFIGVRQRMSEQDIKWMLQAWPRLKFIYGRTHFEKSQRHRHQAILKEHHIGLGSLSIFDVDDDEE
ncbi:hypothetical protein BGZ80_005660 [Entomortierella chlamydospora]|uniref:F-box domain-containing protein n=1 Tax=Entomortierella chlamydospora TaxID=101097 RepID=A0A9P6MZC5_9FUNG|nr:hypothetical protein BGZ79_006270 [Entomortierella chlamydospora]KAG0019529.1 hypothetical protein BGZ80_005660 [Entomortierella chlamydospora]